MTEELKNETTEKTTDHSPVSKPKKTATIKDGTPKKTSATKKAVTAKKESGAGGKVPTKKTSNTKKAVASKTTAKKVTDKKTATKKLTPKAKKPLESLADLVLTDYPENNENMESVLEAVDLGSDQKKSLEDILKEKEEAKELVKEEAYDHVEILRKKREAQKKLNEELFKEKENKERELISKLQAKMEESVEEVDDAGGLVLNDRISQLEEDNARLAETISALTDELKNKDNLINQQDDELKDKNEQIIVLTNSIISEQKGEEEGTHEENIRELSDESFSEIKEQGDILLRIRLLNEKIEEKETQIKLVEEELNRLGEQDIFEKEFIQQIKKVREQRGEVVNQANYELNNLAIMIRASEEKLNLKKEIFTEKENSLKDFDKAYQEKVLTYTEKEEEKKKRSPLSAEVDALKIEIENLDENYRKLINRYKDRLKKAEESVEELSKIENKLIHIYLAKLREQKSNENENYQHQKTEHKALLNALAKLNNRYEELKTQEKDEFEEKIEDSELDDLKKQLASCEGKLALLRNKRFERENVEEVLRTSDPEIKQYLDAFNQREIISFEVANDKLKSQEIQEKLKVMTSKDHKEYEKLVSHVSRYEIIIEESIAKMTYLEKIVKQYGNDEKVIFYKQLLKSLADLDDYEMVLAERSRELRNKIISKEDELKG